MKLCQYIFKSRLQETPRKSKLQTEAGKSTPGVSAAPKVKSARKNLARLIIEHDAANRSSATVETLTSHTGKLEFWGFYTFVMVYSSSSLPDQNWYSVKANEDYER